MTAKEYATLHKCDVSGVYKKIKSGKLSIENFESRKQKNCVECGATYMPMSNVSLYCTKTCSYRAQDRKKRESDPMRYYALRSKCNKNYQRRHPEKARERAIRYLKSGGKEKQAKARHVRMQNQHIREYVYLKARMWYKNNPEKAKARQKKRSETMPVEYIKSCLKVKHDVSMELVEQRRIQLKIKRKIHEINRQINAQ